MAKKYGRSMILVLGTATATAADADADGQSNVDERDMLMLSEMSIRSTYYLLVAHSPLFLFVS